MYFSADSRYDSVLLSDFDARVRKPIDASGEPMWRVFE